MKLSTKARYALRAMMAISTMTGDRKPLSLGKVADSTGLSRRYLEQLVVSLRNASLLRSVSGRQGGHLLARKADEIRIGEIIEAAIGPISVAECVKSPEMCMKSDFCECRLLYELVNTQIRNALNQFTLADLTGANWREKIGAQLEIATGAGVRGQCPEDEQPEDPDDAVSSV